MDKQEYFKQCPQCDGQQSYKTAKSLKVAIKNNTICKSCASANRLDLKKPRGPMSEAIKEAIRQTHLGNKDNIAKLRERGKNNIGEKNPMFGKKGQLCHRFGCKVSEETKTKLRASRIQMPLSEIHKNNIRKGLKGKTHSSETKRKMRIAHLKHLEKNGFQGPRYNQTACDFFEKLEKSFIWNGIFARKNKEFFIGELGYFVDYYEPNFNIVIEFDEPKHYTIDNCLKNKDTERMTEIIKVLNCYFYRYNQRTKELKKYDNKFEDQWFQKLLQISQQL